MRFIREVSFAFFREPCYNAVMSKLSEEREQKKAEREDRRIAKREARMEKHTVICPHCGKNALDHMTECPHCKGKLTPRGYQPMEEGRLKKIRTVLFLVGLAVAIGVIVLVSSLK